jgi:shikimate dehydrogenase
MTAPTAGDPIDGGTALAFLFGDPVSHSLSPAMHQAAFRAAGLNAAYLPWAVAAADLPDAIRALRGLHNFLGANLTIPHKEAVISLLDRLTLDARAIGAVNTIVRQGDALLGDNTDAAGFLASLAAVLPDGPKGAITVVLGAGGAARAVAVALARAGCGRVQILNRTPARALQLAAAVAAQAPDCTVVSGPLEPAARLDPAADLVVNTTAVGLRADDPPLFAYERLDPHAVVYDLIYRPPETPLLAAARRRGCRSLNGLGMLLEQGALAFERWTGRPAPRAVMRAALEARPAGGC